VLFKKARLNQLKGGVMSIHSSLRSGGKDKKHRSVLKRYERLKMLKDKNLWDEAKPVLGIPKVKMQKLRVKKEKAAATDAGTAGATAPAAGKPAAAAAPKPEKK
jgi:small basic protein (TIGR04137 family)